MGNYLWTASFSVVGKELDSKMMLPAQFLVNDQGDCPYPLLMSRQLVAKSIAEGIREASDMQITLHELKEINLEQPADFDVLSPYQNDPDVFAQINPTIDLLRHLDNEHPGVL